MYEKNTYVLVNTQKEYDVLMKYLDRKEFKWVDETRTIDFNSFSYLKDSLDENFRLGIIINNLNFKITYSIKQNGDSISENYNGLLEYLKNN